MRPPLSLMIGLCSIGLFAAQLVWHATEAHGVFEVETEVEHMEWDPGLPRVLGYDHDTVQNPTEAVISEIIGFGSRGRAAGDQFGNVGVAVEISTVPLAFDSTLVASITVTNTDFVNLLPFPANASLDFLIVPGSLLVFGQGIEANYMIQVDRLAPAGHPTRRWESHGNLVQDVFGFTFWMKGGEDIGTPDAGSVPCCTIDIPLSGQHFDLGLVLPGEQFGLRYTMEIGAGIRGGRFAEIISANLGDPFNLATSPGFNESNPGFLLGGVTFTPASLVPEPSTLTLFALGILGLIGYVFRRRERPV